VIVIGAQQNKCKSCLGKAALHADEAIKIKDQRISSSAVAEITGRHPAGSISFNEVRHPGTDTLVLPA